MPPAVVVVLLVAIGVPAAARSVTGRPRHLLATVIATVTAALSAQVAGEVVGGRSLVLGDAQVGLALAAAIVATVATAIIERPSLG